MKINLYFKTRSGPWGGANQFINNLKAEFAKRGLYVDRVEDSDVIIFNGYQDLRGIWKSYLVYPNKIRVYRLGPILFLHRGIRWLLVDWAVIFTACLIADRIVFQSNWSYSVSSKLGFWASRKTRIISNAVSSSAFNVTERLAPNQPLKLIYTSWSANPNKGFSFLEYLDNHLDFNKYQFNFIGNTKSSFVNIQKCPAVSGEVLATYLKSADIFVAPTKNDACSNAILEALSCGLPVVALNSGANREIIKSSGEVFMNEKELMEKIDLVAKNLNFYKKSIKVKTIKEITDEYLNFIQNV